ncbi:uncharacterized protein JCM10292_000052 [Rhodotorula paludigena]|uniref:uncharacterized protein n=1 Tax=Rhodotorula paludigena TaxID=86838 RepID=UPI00317BE875
MATPGPSMRREGGQRYLPCRVSPTSSIVPDSVSPEPLARKHHYHSSRTIYDEQTDRFGGGWDLPPRQRLHSTGTSEVADSLFREDSPPPLKKVKREENEDDPSPRREGWSLPSSRGFPPTHRSESAFSASSYRARYTRSRSPSLADPIVKPEIKDEEVDARLYDSRVNTERRRPDRDKSRAPSAFDPAVAVKAEHADEAEGAFGDSAGGHEAEGPMLPPRRKPRALARHQQQQQQQQRDGGPSSGSESGRSSDEDDEDGDGLDESPEGTPFADPPVHKKRKRKVTKPKKPAILSKKQAAAATDDFFASMNLPQPSYEPIGAKRYVTNFLARATANLPKEARVDDIGEATSIESVGDDREEDPGSPSFGRAPPALPGEPLVDFSPQLDATPYEARRAPSPTDSLPDFDESDVPEAPVAPILAEEELLEEQAYFSAPTKKGAVDRWILALGRDTRPLSDEYSFSVFQSDRQVLARLGAPIPPACVSFMVSREFQGSDGSKLVTTRPSASVCADIWADLLVPSHEQRHVPAPSGGRSCLCPLFVPSSRRTWDQERFELAKKDVQASDIMRVLEEVFELSDDVLGRQWVDGSSAELVQLIYDHNWLFHTQIIELARVARISRLLASPYLVDWLKNHIAYRRRTARLEIEEAMAGMQQEQKRADWEGRNADPSYHRLVLSLKTRSEQDEMELTLLRDRLEKHAPVPTTQQVPSERHRSAEVQSLPVAQLSAYEALKQRDKAYGAKG